MTKDKALKLALEALDDYLLGDENLPFKCAKALAAIREALAQPEQEPVAWSYWQSCLNDDGTQTAPWVHRLSKFKPNESIINKDIVPLYTTPPQRTWQGLTDEEYSQLHDGLYQQGKSLGWVVDQIEAKLIERNV